MNKIVDYLVVEGVTAYDLQDKVKKAMLNGWQPLGGIGAYAKNTSTSLFQNMVGYAKEESK